MQGEAEFLPFYANIAQTRRCGVQRKVLLFALVACLAAAWTAWLAYWVVTAADPVVVSAPQLHFASLVIAGEVQVKDNRAEVKIIKVFKDDFQKARQQPLPEVIQVQWEPEFSKVKSPLMLLACLKMQGGAGQYEIAPIPMPHGFRDPRVYPFTESVRIQAERILSPHK